MCKEIIKKALTILTTDVLENKKPLLEILTNLKLSEDNKIYLIIKSDHWPNLYSDKVFIEKFEPIVKYKLLREGFLGDLQIASYKLNLLTNAFEDTRTRTKYECAMLFIENTQEVFALSDINLGNEVSVEETILVGDLNFSPTDINLDSVKKAFEGLDNVEIIHSNIIN